MPISCPHCHRTFSPPPQSGNDTCSCPHCLKTFLVTAEEPFEAYLEVLEGEASGKRIRLKSRMVMGRGTECEIVLADPNSSRQHAEISFRKGRFWIKDLDSRNGVTVNGVRTAESELSTGDVLRLGKLGYRFVSKARSTRTFSIPKLQLDSLDDSNAHQEEVDRFEGFVPPSLVSLEGYQRVTHCLQTVYDVAESLAGVTDVEQILARILSPVLTAVSADRAFVVLRNTADGDFKIRASRLKNESSTHPIVLSRSIIKRVVTEKVALLVADVTLDERFDSQHSIVSQGIRSLMCAPLAIGPTVFGLLVVDTIESRRVFNSEDLKMLSAIARQASVALDNVRLLHKVAEEVKTRGTLERYLSPEVVDQVVKRSLDMELGGQVRELTVLFSDLRGFTTMASGMSPVEVLSVVNDHFSLMVDTLFRYGATLDKFLGDSVMAFWGAPALCADAPLRAVLCAIEMQSRMTDYNQQCGTTGKPPLAMGIGINTGEAVVGNIGSPRRYEYSALGDTVNVASRLQGLAKGGQILISEATRKGCGERIVTSNPIMTTVKGKETAFAVYLVTGRR